MATVLKNSVNEERLLSLVHNFFDNPESVMLEIAQNAARSEAKKMDVVLKKDYLKVRDDGKGIDNPVPLFVLADSDWSQDVERDQTPAGWGLFYLYSLSEKVILWSQFGRIEFECERFFSDPDYRKNVLCMVDSENVLKEGFELETFLKPGISEKLNDNGESLVWFPMEIFFNGMAVPHYNLDHYKKKNGRYLEVVYEGNRVLINPYTVDVRKGFFSLETIWYGVPIEKRGYGYYHPKSVVIDVKNGSALTPVLPYRRSLKSDEKFEKFREFVRKTAVDHLIFFLNNRKEDVLLTMNALERLATQEELDLLDRFYVIKEEPYHDPCYEYGGVASMREKILVQKDSSLDLVNEKLVLKGLEGRNISLPEDVLLPAGVVKSVKLPGKYPSWLPGKISEKEVRVIVAVDKASEIYSGSYLGWMKAKIKGAGALVVNDSWPIVFYENPDEVFNEDLAELAFVNFVYCEDHDTYDTQFEDFMRCAEGDHMKLTGKYDLSKLLFGLWLSGISPFDVHSLKVEKKAGKMVVMTDKGEKTLRI